MARSVITLAGTTRASMNGGHGGSGHRLGGSSGKAGMMTTLINDKVQVIKNSVPAELGTDPVVHLKLSTKSASKDKQKHAGGR